MASWVLASLLSRLLLSSSTLAHAEPREPRAPDAVERSRITETAALGQLLERKGIPQHGAFWGAAGEHKYVW